MQQFANNIRWPAEWEPHAATWLAWPHNVETWPGKFEPVPAAFSNMARAMAQFEPVHILAEAGPVADAAHRHLQGAANVFLHDIATDDAWIRDYGPTFVLADSTLQAIDWRYNAWGGKYPPWENDSAAAGKIASVLNCATIRSEHYIEGGAIEGNGLGDVLTTRSCLLNANRTAASATQVENELREKLGAERIHWLSGGSIAGDDTDGHIDQVARFVNASTIVAASEMNSADPNHGVLNQLHAELKRLRDGNGEPFEIISLPLPAPIYFREQRLPASYANFCFVNNGLIVPQFNDPADEPALKLLSDLAPDRTVVGVDALDLVLGLGGPHCMSQQQPAN